MTMLRSAALGAAALGLVAVTADSASAQGWGYRRGWNPGAAAAVGVLGGLAVGSAIAAGSAPAYAAPVYGPPPVAYAPPVAYGEECYVERRSVWVPGWGWRVRPETVCY